MSRIILTLVAFVALLLGPASVAAAAEGSAGAVYTLTNTTANAVIVYDRSASGALAWSGTFPTGGSGGPLGSQGAVVISDDGRWLYAVDAGSNDVAVFEITKDGLTWSDRIASGGTQPVSVTASHDLVYVVNAASSSIAGFRSNAGKASQPAISSDSEGADHVCAAIVGVQVPAVLRERHIRGVRSGRVRGLREDERERSVLVDRER